MNITVWQALISLLAGLGLGLLYFGGLWWTVRRLPETHSPVLLAFASFILRLALVLTGFYYVMGRHWERLLLCLAGFVVARLILVRRLRPPMRNSASAVINERQ